MNSVCDLSPGIKKAGIVKNKSLYGYKPKAHYKFIIIHDLNLFLKVLN
jgi:hypothetical protein